MKRQNKMAQFPPFALSMLVMAALWLSGFVYVCFLYRKYHNTAYLTLGLASLSMLFWSSLMAFAFIYQSNDLFRICLIFYAIALFFAVLFFDIIWRESPNVYQMTIIGGLAMVISIVSWYPDAVVPTNIEGYLVPYWNGTVLVISVITLVISLIFCSVIIYKLWKRMPPKLKKKMWGFIPGIIILAPGSLLGYLLGGFFPLSIFAVVGIAILGFFGIRNPQILYLLPSRVHRLLVIDKNSGISCFDYKWTESEVNEILLAGLVKALQNISYEILNGGNIQEVKLDNGLLLLHDSKLITVGLFASNSSKYLKMCLKRFTSSFDEKYKSIFEKGSFNVYDFETAEQLVEEHFANIPR